MTETNAGSNPKGNLVVLILIGLGVLAGFISVTYWLGVIERTWPEGKQTTSATVDQPEQVAEELEQIRNTYLEQRETGDVTSVVRALEEFTKRNPNLPEGYVFFAQVMADTQNYDPAIENLKKSLSLKPDQPDVHMLLANLAMMQGQSELADSHLRQAKQLNPDAARYNLHIAQLRIDQGKPDEARQLLLTALEMDSSLHEAHAMLGDLSARLGDRDAAVIRMQAAIDLLGDPDSDRHTLYLRKQATFLRQAKRPTEALNLLRSLSVEERSKIEVLGELAECWELLGEPSRAASLYEQMLIVYPDDWRLSVKAAGWRIKSKNKERAQRHVNTLKRINPSLPAIKKLQSRIDALP